MYLVKLCDKINNTEQIIFKPVSLESYETLYRFIFDNLNSNDDLTISFTYSTAKSTIFKCENTQEKGYLYNRNTLSNITHYELSLVKINDELSSLLNKNISTQTTKTLESIELKKEIKHKYKSSQMEGVINELAIKISLPNLGLKSCVLDKNFI